MVHAWNHRFMSGMFYERRAQGILSYKYSSTRSKQMVLLIIIMI